jgi:hypothetical protein
MSRTYWDEIVPFLSPEVVNAVWPLWEFRLPSARFAELQAVLAAHGRPIQGIDEYHRQRNQTT